MTVLSIYSEDGKDVIQTTQSFKEICDILQKQGVQFEQWEASKDLPDSAEQDEVLAVYEESIQQLKEQYKFQSVDVIALRPDNPKKAEFRKKFLAEHTHDDFEIRFFVDGSGLFYLHIDSKVYLLLCEKGDLLSVPANTTHWFDMGENPEFKCIRFFITEDGWVGKFTGNNIAESFPAMDDFVSQLS